MSPLCCAVRRVGVGAYIQSGTLNGEPLAGRAWLHVDEVHAGGSLALTMGPKAGAHWGSQLPPSFTPNQEGRLPRWHPHQERG